MRGCNFFTFTAFSNGLTISPVRGLPAHSN
jgi:hypothetical protein